MSGNFTLEDTKRIWCHIQVTEDIYIRRIISTVRPTVNTIPSRKRSFSKTLFKLEKMKTPASGLNVDDKQFENGTFRNLWCHNDHVISRPSFPQAQMQSSCTKSPVIVTFSNFSRGQSCKTIAHVTNSRGKTGKRITKMAGFLKTWKAARDLTSDKT